MIKYTTIAGAIVVMFFGFSVIIGWHAHIDSLIRYTPNTIAMVYNSAITFVASGACILALVYERRQIALILACLILSISSLAFAQHVFNIDLNIDQLLFNHYDYIDNKYPGRMAPNTALCFIFTAVNLLILNFNKIARKFISFSISIGLVTFSLALVFFIGYITDLEHAYAWGDGRPVSTTAAVGFILLSLSLISLTCYKAKILDLSLTGALPWIISFCVFISSSMLAYKMGELENINNYNSNLPEITFIAGAVLAIMFGLFIQLGRIAFLSARHSDRSLSLMHAMLEATADGILVTDINREIVFYNQKFLAMWGLPIGTSLVLNRNFIIDIIASKIKNKDEYLFNRNDMLLHMQDGFVQKFYLKDGKIYERYIKPQYLNGLMIGLVCSYRDITQQEKMQKKLLQLVTYDHLTQLPNRALLTDIINLSLVAAKESDKIVGIFLFDIDSFSQIIDLFGRSKADALLKKIVERLKSKLPSDCILGRLDGGEFLIVKAHLKGPDKALEIVKYINQTMLDPFDIMGQEIKLTMAIGIAFYPKDGQETDVLISNADLAMLIAKKDDRNKLQFYTPDMNDYIIKRMQLEVELQRSIDEQQFILHYQPLIDLKQNKPIGVEALIRWQHPTRGLISPLEFIPLAEDLGLIPQIGQWVLLAACRQSKAWTDQGFPNIRMAVNVSALQFKSGMLSKDLDYALVATGANAKNLEIELTESALFDSSNEAMSDLQEIASLNIRMSIDDFGAGYSSFSKIKNFPINTLKIDRTFIVDAMKSEKDAAIVKAIIAMGKNLDVTIVAEGVETQQQLDMLLKAGCDIGQGYFFAHPMDPGACINFFENYK